MTGASLDIFEPQDSEDQADLLAAHLPVGRVWQAAHNSSTNLYKLLTGLSLAIFRLELLVKILSDEIDILQTVQLIQEWERSVGIPDDCFDREDTLEVRRQNVLRKFSNLGGVQTAVDFERIAAIFGIEVTVIPGGPISTFPLIFPFIFFSSAKAAKHSIIVKVPEEVKDAEDFPYTFPLEFKTGIPGFLWCIFQKLAPANVKVIFQVEREVSLALQLLTEDGTPLLTESGRYIYLEQEQE